MLILASASPRRAELLRDAGIAFTARSANIPEQHQPGESAVTYVRRLAEAKAKAVKASPAEIVLAADTTVHLKGRILEKPNGAVRSLH